MILCCGYRPTRSATYAGLQFETPSKGNQIDDESIVRVKKMYVFCVYYTMVHMIWFPLISVSIYVESVISFRNSHDDLRRCWAFLAKQIDLFLFYVSMG